MPWLKWLPWRYIIRRAARAQGFIDPISVLARLHRFQEPSEVAEPLELLRAGVVFHARGLLNTKAIQHNLDWIWPYWVERQFDPRDESFIPRAFSLTHINLTHRNWTAVGIPGCDQLIIVDPRGLVMPFWDSWSVDSWIISDEEDLLPSRIPELKQELSYANGLSTITTASTTSMSLQSKVTMEWENDLADRARCHIEVTGKSEKPAKLVVSIRPYNPEGVSFIHQIELREKAGVSLMLDGNHEVKFSKTPAEVLLSNYREGDIYSFLKDTQRETKVDRTTVTCDVGMATAGMVYPLSADKSQQVSIDIPLWTNSGLATSKRREMNRNLSDLPQPAEVSFRPGQTRWHETLQDAATIAIPSDKWRSLFDASLRTLALLTSTDVYPGPYTYKRFWFRDAAFILNALLDLGLTEPVRRALDTFPTRQLRNGYFRSQAGEWDSNGQVLWIFRRYLDVSGKGVPESWIDSIIRGARWIKEKRLSTQNSTPHSGLLPPGFSAEHLGPNDYYYWDNFWSISGLEAASSMLQSVNQASLSREFLEESCSLMRSVENSFEFLRQNPQIDGIPASPYRRMDSGAIGSIVAGYPLELWEKRDLRLLNTIETLLNTCFINDAFFQDMIHSGLNPYLSLHVAEVLLRAGDKRFHQIVSSIANLASATGQWPEAIHPRTFGGCMGDGQHAWASAEWISILRRMFLTEEDNCLVLGQGLLSQWLTTGTQLAFGPTGTRYGKVRVCFSVTATQIEVQWTGTWHRHAPEVQIRVPDFQPVVISGLAPHSAVIDRRTSN